jgi:hypothetical protein
LSGYCILGDFLRSSGSGRGSTQPLSTIEELLERSSGSGLEIEITALGIRQTDHATPLYPQKLTLTSPTSGADKSHGVINCILGYDTMFPRHICCV